MTRAPEPLTTPSADARLPSSSSAAPGSDRLRPREAAAAAAAQAEAEAVAKQRRVSDGAKSPVLPDCCNLGIALRIVVPVNVGSAIVALGQSQGIGDALNRFLPMAVVAEPVLLASLVCLCAVRRFVNGWKPHWQWIVAAGLPAMLALLVATAVHPVVLGVAPVASVTYWVLVRGIVTAAVAWLIVELLRWRALAYSPSLAEARLQALQARIRPHFLFNSLNTVLGLMRSDPRKAERTLEDLADLFRVFMRDTRALVALEEEVVTCQQYLAIEQLRLGERLKVRWQLDEMPADALLPSLLLQPLIENSVHHGIEPSTEVGEITIRITRPGDRVRVEIVNPVSSVAPTRPGNQMALSNVRERLMLLYDMEAELQTASDGKQFTLFLEFPYRKERRRRDVRRHFNPDR